jgi:nitrite reductase (NADH) small subunit
LIWHDVGDAGTLETDGVIIARVEGREIGVILDRETGELHAMRNRCPHNGAPLCKGSVRPRLEGEPGRYQLDDRRMLHCPWHGWQFELSSGRCPDNSRMRVAVYDVRIEAGRVVVSA